MNSKTDLAETIHRLKLNVGSLSSTEYWKRLKELHMRSQPFWREHMQTHLLMLSHAIRSHHIAEIFVQMFFTAVSAPSSILKLYPKDHPGTVTIK